MYAIFKCGGKQHRVGVGDSIKVELLEAGEGEEVTFEPILVADGDHTWTPRENPSLKVTARVQGQGKRRKVLVFHKKRRKQYKKIYGHRQPFTELKILDITAG